MRPGSLVEPPALLLLFLFLLLLLFSNLSDPDYFWHLKSGELIAQTGALPEGDPFSYTMVGRPWVMHEWLFQLPLYLLHAWWGDWCVRVMTALLAIAPLIIIYRTMIDLGSQQRMSSWPLLSALIVFFFAVPMAGFAVPRPQLFSFLFFALYLGLLLQLKYRKRSDRLWLLPAIMLCWVNMHAGFMIGIALLLLFLACEWAGLRMHGQPDPDYRRMLWRLLLATLATIAASAANPDFIAHWLYPFRVMDMEAAKRLIIEWRGIDFHEFYALCTLLLVALFVLLNLLRDRRPDISESVLPLGFVFAAMFTYRHLPFALLLLMPLSGVAIRDGAGRRLAESRIGLLYRHHIAQGRQMGRLQPLANGLLAVLVLAAMLLYYPTHAARQQQSMDARVPVHAVDFIVANGISGRMFNTYRFGGYLIYRLYPEQRVFIDGRADLYGDRFLLDYERIYSGGAGWRQLFDHYRIDYVICTRTAPIRRLLADRDFRLVYDDAYNSVLVRDIPRFAALIREHGLRL